jgi:cysteine desulfurase
MKSNKIYLDYAASVEPNPSSIHTFGREMKKKLENARAEVAGILSARKDEIIFTSGGTESNNLAIQGVIYQYIGISYGYRKFLCPHIITTNIEHPSVLETCRMLEQRKIAQISIVPVEPSGIVDPKKIKKEIKKNTVLVSVMYANNEIGTIQPIKEIAKEIRHFNKKNARKILFHTDAVQAVNYLDLNVEKLGVDMLSLSGSKIEGAGRVGVLYKKRGVELASIFGGGDQENGLRPGTENLPGIVKFSSALKSIQDAKVKEAKRLTQLRDYFFTKLQHSNILKNVGMLINGDLKNRLPNNLNITFPKIPSDLLVIELSAKGIMASSKSACKSSKSEGSYVIKALRWEVDPEIGGLRFSLGRGTTKKDIDYTVQVLLKILTKLKKWYN